MTGPQGAALRPPTLLEVERLELADATTAAALTLAAQGFSVFPVDHPWWAKCRGAHGSAACDGKRGKHPTVPWSTRATTDPAAVNRMFGEGPFNIGIACGPSGLLVVDQDGRETLKSSRRTSGWSSRTRGAVVPAAGRMSCSTRTTAASRSATPRAGWAATTSTSGATAGSSWALGRCTKTVSTMRS